MIILGNYRCKLDIIAAILYVASKTAKKTQIMYQANLSYKVLQRYLFEIESAHLVIFSDKNQCYSLTEKGRSFLQAYEKYSVTNRNVEKRLVDVASKKKILEDLCADDAV